MREGLFSNIHVSDLQVFSIMTMTSFLNPSKFGDLRDNEQRLNADVSTSQCHKMAVFLSGKSVALTATQVSWPC